VLSSVPQEPLASVTILHEVRRNYVCFNFESAVFFSLFEKDHLFWKCSFSLKCRESININLDDNLELAQMMDLARSNFGRYFED
jgi:hypothetical protein